MSVSKQEIFEGFAKKRNEFNMSDVERIMVPDFWTADGKGALPELGPCSQDNSVRVVGVN